MLVFERAEKESDPSVREKLLTLVIVGGGPTGVEMAGAISELTRKALAADFRRIDPRNARVVLIEAGQKLLPTYPEPLSAYAKQALENLGVEVRIGEPVTHCDADGVRLGSERINAGTIIWAAGIAASPAADWLRVTKDQVGRVVVGPRLEVGDRDEVFVIGDAALVRNPQGHALAGIAPVAKQQGVYVGKLIAARIQGNQDPKPFHYRSAGQLATIGRHKAIVDMGMLRIRGRLAWWFWGLAHIYFLINIRNRLTVAIQWLWSYLTFDRGARLITGDQTVGTMTHSGEHSK